MGENKKTKNCIDKKTELYTILNKYPFIKICINFITYQFVMCTNGPAQLRPLQQHGTMAPSLCTGPTPGPPTQYFPVSSHWKFAQQKKCPRGKASRLSPAIRQGITTPDNRPRARPHWLTSVLNWVPPWNPTGTFQHYRIMGFKWGSYWGENSVGETPHTARHTTVFPATRERVWPPHADKTKTLLTGAREKVTRWGEKVRENVTRSG